jgi:hypothetical protein
MSHKRFVNEDRLADLVKLFDFPVYKNPVQFLVHLLENIQDEADMEELKEIAETTIHKIQSSKDEHCKNDKFV